MALLIAVFASMNVQPLPFVIEAPLALQQAYAMGKKDQRFSQLTCARQHEYGAAAR